MECRSPSLDPGDFHMRWLVHRKPNSQLEHRLRLSRRGERMTQKKFSAFTGAFSRLSVSRPLLIPRYLPHVLVSRK